MVDGASFWAEEGPLVTESLELLDPNIPPPIVPPNATCQGSLQTRGVTQPQHLWVLHASYHSRDWK